MVALIVSTLLLAPGCNLYRELEGLPIDTGGATPDITEHGEDIRVEDSGGSDVSIPDASETDVGGEDTSQGADVTEDTSLPDEERSRDGLVLYYPFLEGSGDSTADTSGVGQAYDLGRSGATGWLNPSGIQLNGGHFEASEGASKLYDALKGSGAFTVELWVRSALGNQGSGNTARARILALANDQGQTNLTLGQNGNRLEVRLRSGTALDGSPFWSIAGAVTTSVVHYALTYNGQRLELFINGVLAVDDNRAGSIGGWDESFGLIMGDGQAYETPWQGDIYQVAVYDRVLEAAEIASHHRIGRYAPSP